MDFNPTSDRVYDALRCWASVASIKHAADASADCRMERRRVRSVGPV
jgi:hypothetical protein